MLRVEIHLKGYINLQWSEWFDGLTVSHSSPDETVLNGLVQDQAALYGIISRLRDLGMQLISLSSEQMMENDHE